jgi:hypothetical protein
VRHLDNVFIAACHDAKVDFEIRIGPVQNFDISIRFTSPANCGLGRFENLSSGLTIKFRKTALIARECHKRFAGF